MESQINSKLLILASFLFTTLLGQGQTPTSQDEMQKQHFDKMANYLSRDNGKWIGENQRYKPDNPRSPKTFGLWFERPMANLLTIKIVSHFEDTTMISSQGIFSWHHEKKCFIHVTADQGNGFSQGASEFPTDTTFISTMTVYRPSGKFYDHRDENFIVDENTHRNISYNKDEEGNWIEKGRWTWVRDGDK